MEDNNTPQPLSAKAIGLRYGLIGGLVMIAYSIVKYVIDIKIYLNFFWGFSGYIALIVAMVFAGIAIKKANKGKVEFKQVLQGVFLTAVVGVVLSFSFATLMLEVIDPDLVKMTKSITMKNTQDLLELTGASEEQIENELDRLEQQNFNTTPSMFLMTLSSQFFIGFIYAVMISGVFALTSKPEPEQHLNA